MKGDRIMLDEIKKTINNYWWETKICLGKVKGSMLQNRFDFKNIKSIEIETFSFCNRQCWFCPNSFLDRHTGNIEMPEKLYLRILEQLAEINFSETLSFSRYNEPLSQKELILKRIRQARKFLPNATLTTNTNGDYVTQEYIDDLCTAGLNSLNIQYYLQENEEFSTINVLEYFEKLSAKIGLAYRICREQEGRIEIEFNHPKMKIIARARDFRKNGCTRGDSLETIAKTKRKTGCLVPYTAVFIDYNGCVMPCCNLRSDFPAHKKYILGDCNNEPLNEIFNNTKTLSFRKNVKGYPRIDMCKNCNFASGYYGYLKDLAYIRERQ